jgi:ribonuclease BN (tRNA processing enzyme)
MTARPTTSITVLGGSGGWPAAGGACSGFLVEHGGFRLLIDPGYATFPRLIEHVDADEVDAVYVTHGHPDHCVDLNTLLRARAFVDDPAPALPVYAAPGELDAVLALDRPGALDEAIDLREFEPGSGFGLGPFRADTWLLPHMRTNAGVRLQSADGVIAYTGDTGPSPALVDLARDADVYIADASYPDDVHEDLAQDLSSAVQAGQTAASAGVRHLVLTHLFPNTSHDDARDAAAKSFAGPITIARPGVVINASESD